MNEHVEAVCVLFLLAFALIAVQVYFRLAKKVADLERDVDSLHAASMGRSSAPANVPPPFPQAAGEWRHDGRGGMYFVPHVPITGVTVTHDENTYGLGVLRRTDAPGPGPRVRHGDGGGGSHRVDQPGTRPGDGE